MVGFVLGCGAGGLADERLNIGSWAPLRSLADTTLPVLVLFRCHNSSV
jgi:hypothetical protein